MLEGRADLQMQANVQPARSGAAEQSTEQAM